jgi:hypothetical protein
MGNGEWGMREEAAPYSSCPLGLAYISSPFSDNPAGTVSAARGSAGKWAHVGERAGPHRPDPTRSPYKTVNNHKQPRPSLAD